MTLNLGCGHTVLVGSAISVVLDDDTKLVVRFAAVGNQDPARQVRQAQPA